MNRRSILLAASAGLAVPWAAAQGTSGGATARGKTFVLVHGAFHGAWCWDRVAADLRARGHRVFTPTLTGCGERAHLTRPDVDLATFVQDVCGVFEAEELQDVVLVGHSFGGYVVTGVADRMASKIARAVFLDAAVATSGRSVFSELPAEVREARMKAAVEREGTRVILPPPAATFGITDAGDLAWANRRLTPMPLRAYDSAITLAKAPLAGVSAAYVRCTRPAIPQVESGAQFARRAGWPYKELATGHDAMITAPTECAEALLA